MISHVYIGITDFDRAFRFYAALMEALGHTLKFSDPKSSMAAWMKPDEPRPLFVIGRPYDRQPVDSGNGNMVALLAPSRECVDRAHAIALAQGGVCVGPPGLRPHYHPNYYGAYFRDLDGTKLCVCCHDPVSS